MGELTWGLPLFFDLWAAGMAGGAFFAAFLLNLFGLDDERRLLKTATYIGVPLVLLGVVLIIADLGEPLRAFNMYIGLRPQGWEMLSATGASSLRLWPPHLAVFPVSPMSIGGWALVLFTLAGIALIVLFLAESAKAWELQGAVGWGVDVLKALRPVTTLVSWAAFGLAILVMAYTGVVLAASSMPLWSATLLLPAMFVSSAILTGVAALILVLGIVKAQGGTTPVLRSALKTLIIVQIVLLALFLIWALSAGVAGTLVSGGLGLTFWVGVVVVGLVLPLLLELGTAKSEGALILLSPLMVVVGGLLLRATVIIAGQM